MAGGLFGALVTLGISIASMVLLIIVINGSAADLLVKLKTDAAQTQTQLDALAARVPAIEACNVQLNDTIMLLMNCSDAAYADSSRNTQLLQNITAVLAQNTVAIFNATLYSAIQQELNRVVLLEAAIANVTDGAAAQPYVVTNGTVQVSLVGGDTFNSSFQIEQLVLGDLRMVYLKIPKWQYSLTTAVGQLNPVIQLGNFTPSIAQTSPSADVVKPLLQAQSKKIQWVDPSIQAVAYKWTSASELLEIYSTGTSAYLTTVAQVDELRIIFQLL